MPGSALAKPCDPGKPRPPRPRTFISPEVQGEDDPSGTEVLFLGCPAAPQDLSTSGSL